jgi:exodeoxyribonuclease X
MVADKPWIEDVIHHYYGSEWYVAHNASFDRRVLPDMPGEWICTMKLSRRLWPGIKYSNMALYNSRKLSVQTPVGLHQHRALYDCYITAALLIDIMNTSGWSAEQMVEITGRPALLTTFTFGKYRGKPVSEVAERDPGYLRWLFNNLDSMSPELRLTLKHYLDNA